MNEITYTTDAELTMNWLYPFGMATGNTSSNELCEGVALFVYCMS